MRAISHSSIRNRLEIAYGQTVAYHTDRAYVSEFDLSAVDSLDDLEHTLLALTGEPACFELSWKDDGDSGVATVRLIEQG